MQSLDPKWLSIELNAIQQEEGDWDKVLKDSYELAVQRVFEYQAKFSNETSVDRALVKVG